MCNRKSIVFIGAILLLTVVQIRAVAEDRPQIPLWANGAPGSESRAAEKEKSEAPNAEHVTLHIWNIHNPSITVYLPPREKASGAAVVIAPGGGHRYLAYDFEGTEVAQWLSDNGIAGIILKYRLAREEGSTYQVETHALADAQRAIRTARARAKEWNLDPQKIGVMGFSAGGQLAALAGTRFDAGKPDAVDPIDRESSRPDFQVLVYGGLREPPAELPKEIPPAFIICAADDAGGTTACMATFTAYNKAAVRTEMHIYEHGGHGFGMRDRAGKGGPVVHWNLQFKEWMKDIGALSGTR